MKAIALYLLCGLALLPLVVHAQNYEKNGLPCIKEICIGDGLNELQSIRWDAVSPQAASAAAVASAAKRFPNAPAAVSAAAPYLKYGAQGFDGRALPLLEAISVGCDSARLVGKFTSPEGNPTRVTVALLPTGDVSRDAWTVIVIQRDFPAAVSQEQRQQVQHQLNERYEAWNLVAMERATTRTGSFLASPNGNLYLGMKLNGYQDKQTMLKKPACGGSAKVKLD